MVALENKDCLSVLCLADNNPACGFKVFLIDDSGVCICQKDTDKNGIAQFFIERSGTYRIKAQSTGNFNLKSISRWRFLFCDQSYHQTFIFNSYNKILGSIRITLRDKAYPEYKLKKGVYNLWLTF